MNHWQECRLGDLVNIKHGWPFKSECFKEEAPDLPIVVGIGNFNYSGGFRFESTKLKGYSGDYPSEYELRPRDILLVMTCQTEGGEILGIPGRIPADGKTYLHNQRLGKVIIKHRNHIESDYLYWLFLTEEFNLHLVNSASGTKILHTAPSRIEDYAFLLPSLAEQRSIAAVLTSLNDKIELLHRQNKTLESMADTLFRKWFFEEQVEGWQQKPLSGIAEFLNGLACQKFLPKNAVDRLPVLKIRELNGGVSEISDWATSNIKPEYIVKTGDVIFAWSASLMVKLWDGERCVLNQHLFKVSSKEYPKWFFLMWCKHHLEEFIAISESHATTMGHIKRGDLDTAIVIVPPPKELNKMSELMEPIIEKQVSNFTQLKTLTKLRDTLLPVLMNGNIKVAL